MNKPSHFPWAVLLASALLAVPAIGAESAPAGDMAQARKCPVEERTADFAKKLDALHTDLKLDASQEAAWGEWSAKMKADGPEDWKSRHKDFEGWENMTAIERMEKKLAFNKERQTKLEDKLAATKTFYATLSDAQRKVFDKQFVIHAHGPGGKWHKR